MDALKGFRALFKTKEAKPPSDAPVPLVVEKEIGQHVVEDELEVIKGIEQMYYEDEDNTMEHELMRLDKFDIHLLDDRIQLLSSQEKAISTRLVRIISDNHFAYVQEMDSVIGIQECLQDAHSTCCNARLCLGTAKRGMSVGTLGLLAKHRYKSRTECLYNTFRDLQQLRKLSLQFRHFLEGGLYPEVIRICVENTQFLKNFGEFDCISDMSERFSKGMQDARIFIEKELGFLYKSFDPDSFMMLYEVLELTGTVHEAIKTTIGSFKEGIRQISFVVVLDALDRDATDVVSRVQGKNFPHLCKELMHSQFATALRKLAKEFFTVMLNYVKLKHWFEELPSGVPEDQVCNSLQIEVKELQEATILIWQEIQRHVKLFMEACDFSALKYEDVISAIQTVQILSVAELEFTGSKSDALQASMRQLTLKYFKLYHRSKMESLHAMMQNEAWEAVPVEATFSLNTLPENQSLHAQVLKSHDLCRVNSNCMFVRYATEGNPFDEDSEEWREDDDVSRPHGPSDSYVDNDDMQGALGPILSNPALTVLKLFGDYMQMMAVLEPISFDVLQCMTHLFDFFLYSVFTFFAQSEFSSGDISQVSGRLGGTLKRIKGTLILDYSETSSSALYEVRIPAPIVFSELRSLLENPDSMYGFWTRIVAVESLSFLATQFKTVAIPLLLKLIPASKHSFVNQYVSQTLSTIDELRVPSYKPVIKALFCPQQMVSSMMQVKWDIHELLSQHNPYIDALLQDVARFKTSMESVREVPTEVQRIVWREGINEINRAFVDGFSQVKSCSNEGRALMQLDYQQFVLKLKSIFGYHHVQGQEFVEQYIKAYYLTEQDIVKWIEQHKEYSPKQISALVSSGMGSHIGKRAKQRIKNLLNFDDASTKK